MKDFLFWYLVICGTFCFMYLAAGIINSVHHSKGIVNYLLGLVFMLCPPLYIIFLFLVIIPAERRKEKKRAEAREKIDKEIDEIVGKVMEEIAGDETSFECLDDEKPHIVIIKKEKKNDTDNEI